jgi:hypothetical protein
MSKYDNVGVNLQGDNVVTSTVIDNSRRKSVPGVSVPPPSPGAGTGGAIIPLVILSLLDSDFFS